MSSPIAFNSGELITDAITSAFFSKATLVAFKMFFTVTLEPEPQIQSQRLCPQSQGY